MKKVSMFRIARKAVEYAIEAGKWAIYEKSKQYLEALNLSTEEYESAIKQLCYRLDI